MAVDQAKYLYWFDSNESSFEQQMVWRELYSSIGYFFHVVQMAEYNIANILSIEEFEKETADAFTPKDIERIKKNIETRYKKLSGKSYTFGHLAKEAETSVYLSGIDKKALGEIVKYRNYLAHECFKEKLLAGSLKTLEEVDAFVDELNEFKTRVVKLNEEVLEIFKQKRIQPVLIQLPN